MWTFCLRSLLREYGWRFAWKMAGRHPLRTLRALREAQRIDVTTDHVDVANGPAAGPACGPPSIVGAGFCLKPLNPPCPSGRANHDCRFLEGLAGPGAADAPAPCRPCAIRTIGTRALRAGSAFYVMTSARDILDDVYVPALEDGRFRTGLFVLCRYSFKPFAVGLLASGMRARMLPLGRGDCCDYRTWLLADRGIKHEQTTMDGAAMAGMAGQFGGAAAVEASRFERCGNVFYPARAEGHACRAVEPS